MDQPTSNASPAPAAPTVAPAPLPPVQMPAPIPQAPLPPPAPQPQSPPPLPAPPVQKSGSPWPWIIGGCLFVIILIVAAVVGLGWWGIREAKKEINQRVDKYEPTLDSMKENVDKMGQEADEWEKESQKIRESMPSPEELEKEFGNMPSAN